MKNLLITVSIIIAFAYTGNSQLTTADKVALEIPEQSTYSTTGISSYIKNHFSSDSERVRAVFVWVANNINYDVEKVRLKKDQSERTTVTDVLKTRKAVCQGYSELFVALCNELNIRSVMVPGYTRRPDGAISDLSHAWVATEINNKWYMFDPTWAAGSVDNWQFTRRFSNRFYKLSPEEMLKDHMPFDPMYQFVNYPIMYDDFNRGNTSINTSKPFFNYTDTIRAYNSLDTLNQFVSAARRINKNGEKNQMIYDMVQVLNKNQQSGQSKVGFEGAVAQFKQATQLFNRYIDYKNNRFSSVKDNKEIEQLIDTVLYHYNAAKALIEPVTPITPEQKQTLAHFNNNFYSFYRRVDEEKIFLRSYLSSRKNAK